MGLKNNDYFSVNYVILESCNKWKQDRIYIYMKIHLVKFNCQNA